MHSESKHGFECTHCDRVFKTSDGRDSHDRTKHCFSCGICDRQFNSEEALDKHTEAKHCFPCGICNRQFSSEEALDQHRDAKHCFPCSICDRQFSSEEALDQHTEAKHPRYECTYCDKEFTSDAARMQHQNAKHGSRPRTVYAPSYLSPPYSQAETAPVEQPSASIFGASFAQKPTPEHPDDKDVLMKRSPKVEVAAPNPVANFACGTCGKPVATIVALEAHELQHRVDSCACTICKRADGTCNCNICNRTNTSTVSVNENLPDRVVTGEPEETTLSADSLGAIEPKVVEDSLVGSCDLVMALESQGATDLSVDRSVPAQGMYLQDQQSLMELEREVCAEHSTPAQTPSPSHHEHPSLDDPTCASDVAMNLTEESNVINPQSGFASMECDTIPCHPNVLEQHSVLDAHAIIQESAVYEHMDSSQPDFSLELTYPETQDHNMSPPEISNDHPTVLDIDMSHEQVDNALERDPLIPGLEPDFTSSSHSTESPANSILVPVQMRSPHVGISELQPLAESGEPFVRNLVPSPTPSEHGSCGSRRVTQDDHLHSESRPLHSPMTSEDSASYFSDADRSSTPSSPLSDHSIVFVSASSIPEYVRENRAYLVATSAPSQPSSPASSCVRLPSVVTSLESLPDQNDHAEVPSAATNGQSPLYCRICLRDPCDDPTATMCGHIFCNRCIIDTVMARSACPVCTAPTLLYCLFRLDV